MENKSVNFKITITFHSKIKISPKKTTDFREIKKKSKNTLIPTDSMLKTLRMSEFNQFLQEGKAYLKFFFQSKSKTT